jgi:WD40 repeat protein
VGPATGTPVGEPPIGHTGYVNAVAAVPLPDGRVLLATGSDDRTVRLWDPATGTPVGEPLIRHTGYVNAVAAVPLPDGRVLLTTGDHNGTLLLWDPAATTVVNRSSLGDPVTGIAVAQDRLFISTLEGLIAMHVHL